MAWRECLGVVGDAVTLVSAAGGAVVAAKRYRRRIVAAAAGGWLPRLPRTRGWISLHLREFEYEMPRFRVPAGLEPGAPMYDLPLTSLYCRSRRTQQGARDVSFRLRGPWDESVHFLLCSQMMDVQGVPPQRQPVFEAGEATDFPGRPRVSGRGFFNRLRLECGDGPPEFLAEFQVSGTPFAGAASLASG